MLKAPPIIFVIFSGIEKCPVYNLGKKTNISLTINVWVNLSHPPKAPSPMYVTEFGIWTIDRLLQPPKAYIPRLVTEFGILTDVRPIQSWKTKFPTAARNFRSPSSSAGVHCLHTP